MLKRTYRWMIWLFIISFIIGQTQPLFAQTTFTYDERGNLISDGVQCYEYNGANQLSAVRNCVSNQLIETYIYDPATGHRLLIEQYQNGQLVNTIFTIDDQYELRIDAATGTEKAYTYVDMPGGRVRNNPDGSRTFSHQDHLGSTHMVTDQSGTLVEETRYYPFGQVLIGGTADRYGYTGQEFDVSTGLNFYDSRYYNSQLAVFVQPDSIRPDVYNPQDLNPYTYVRNNPTKYKDSSGNSPLLSVLIDWGLDGFDIGRAYWAKWKPGATELDNAYGDKLLEDVTSARVLELQVSSIGGRAGIIASQALPADDVIRIAIRQGPQQGLRLITGFGLDHYDEAVKAVGFRGFTRTNFRSNLVKFTNMNPASFEAHHVFPDAFADKFSKLGINVHNPMYGAWWKQVSDDPNSHRARWSDYNKLWSDFLAHNPSKEDVLNYGHELAKKFDFSVNY